MTGPAMVTIPVLYQQSGWLTPTLAFVIVGILTYFASCFLCEAMASVPGNNKFQGRIEFSTLARFYFGHRGHVASQVFINVSLQCLNIASIIIAAQVMDDTVIAIFHKTCGVSLHPSPGWLCTSRTSSGVSPFDGNIMLITAGYLATLAFTIPLGLLNLDDNVYIQVFALVFLFVALGNWFATFFMAGMQSVRVPVSGADLSDVMGNVIFNYGFITTVPSWINEKRPGVGVHSTLAVSVITSCLIFVSIGWLGGMAFDYPSGSDLLSVIVSSPLSNKFDLVMLYLFPPVILSLTIPVFSIVVRYNLLQNKVCNKGLANFFAVVLPWLVVIPFMTGEGLMIVIGWSSLFFTSVSNFILPFVLYMTAVKFKQDYHAGRVTLTEDQKQIIADMNIPEVTTVSFSAKVDEESPLINSLNHVSAPLLPGGDAERSYKALPEWFFFSRTPRGFALGAAALLLVAVIGTIVSNLYMLIRYGDYDIS
eukprot:TRINITY_DN1616_c0_g1_i3.p1 TRINITY_DN1616_c0_g1~~TRINITY_DN1616_c0_g1_i3.p1  ORF type:complete len:544 (-),score=152.42 TRINITY_DN1616_c0_g1_i3:105-1541(-)